MKTDVAARKVHARLSLLIVLIGAALMAGKIYADSEPGLIPLLLVASGMGWYFVTRVRRRAAAVE